MPGQLTNISISNKQLYGVNRDGNIYYMAMYNSGIWVGVTGKLVQVSLDGYNNIVVGVNASQQIFYADQNIQTTPNWTLLPGGLKYISISNKQLYGVNSGNQIYYMANYKTGSWVGIPGSLVQVSLDGYYNVVAGFNSSNTIYYADQNIQSRPNWTTMTAQVKAGGVVTTLGKLQYLSISNKQLCCINTNGNIFYMSNYKNTEWESIATGLTQIAIDVTTPLLNTSYPASSQPASYPVTYPVSSQSVTYSISSYNASK